MVKKIAHVAVATESIAVLTDFYKMLGLNVASLETLEDQKVKVAMIPVGESLIELLEPTEDDSPVGRFLEKRGEGIHHISLEVDDLDAYLEKLKEQNVRLIDEEARTGVGGDRIAFIHPDSAGGVLVELCERAEGND